MRNALPDLVIGSILASYQFASIASTSENLRQAKIVSLGFSTNIY
ncbi:MAG: hypothetical protein ACI9CE_001389 [Flavobacterium sp.]|jgi:hypothetical protein